MTKGAPLSPPSSPLALLSLPVSLDIIAAIVFVPLQKSGAVKEQTRYEFTDLHASNLPSMPTPEKEETVRKRLLDMFQPYGAMQVRVLHRESKNFGYGCRTLWIPLPVLAFVLVDEHLVRIIGAM